MLNTEPIPKYPNVHVQLVGTDGNAFSILARVSAALRDSQEVPNDEVGRFHIEATSGDYDHLLATCVKWVQVS